MPGDPGASSAGLLELRPEPGIARLALNQPERRNALSDQLARELREALGRIRHDPAVRVLIVAGEGPAFCAGADLGSLAADAETPEAKRAVLAQYYRAFLDLRELPMPTIAAVQGPAIGAGLNLALCCDLRLLSEDARLAAPFVKLGIHPGGGATWMLARLAGPAAAREILLLGEPLDAARALELGLASRVVPRAELESAALEWARSLARLPKPVLSQLKRTLGLAEAGADLDTVLQFETEAQAESLASQDAHEGWQALRERRAPHFRDR